MQQATITNEQKIPAILNPQTATGKPAPVDGAPTWAIISGPGTIVPAADGLSCFIISQDAVDPDPLNNVTTVEATADADIGGGVEEIKEAFVVSVVSAKAANLGATFGAAVAK